MRYGYRHITRRERLDMNHKKVEAMYRRGCSVDEIAMDLELMDMDVWDIIQKIYHLDQRKAWQMRKRQRRSY